MMVLVVMYYAYFHLSTFVWFSLDDKYMYTDDIDDVLNVVNCVDGNDDELTKNNQSKLIVRWYNKARCTT